MSDPTPDPAAKRPLTALAGRYGHPVHPALVAVPIGAWVASLLFDIASHTAPTIGGDPEMLAHGARWLIGIGVLTAAVAATAGALDLLALPAGTRVQRTGLWHMALALCATAAFAVSFALRSDAVAPVPVPSLVLSAAALAILLAAGYLGGTLAYRYGVRVVDERTQADGYTTTRPTTPKEHH